MVPKTIVESSWVKAGSQGPQGLRLVSGGVWHCMYPEVKSPLRP